MTTPTPRMPARRRGTRLAALAGTALLALTGCMQADFGMVLNDDESGRFHMRAVVNREQIEALTDMFGDMMAEEGAATTAPADVCEEVWTDMQSDTDLPDDAVVERVDEGGWCGASVTVPFDNFAELEQLTAGMSDSDDDSEEVSTGVMAISKTAGGGYRFEVAGLEMSEEEMGTSQEEAASMGAVFEQMLDDMRISYDVRLPGNPVDHNADVVEGNRFYWEVKFGDARDSLFAETAPGEPDGSSNTGDGFPDYAAGNAALTGDSGDAGDDGATGGDDGAAGGESGAGSSDDGDDGSSLTWLWIVLGIVVVGAAIAAIVLVKRKGDKTPPAPPAPPASPLSSPPPPAPGQSAPGWNPPTEQ